MMPAKGGIFERDISRQLSLWWTKGKTDDCFWRNRTRRTIYAYNAQMQEGDIVAVREIGTPFTDMFCIECKAGYSLKKNPTRKTKEKRSQIKEKVKNIPWDLLEILDAAGNYENFTIVKFWEQAQKAAVLTHKIPLLIFKRDYHAPVIVVNDKFLNLFIFDDEWHLNQIGIIVSGLIKDEFLYFYSLENFLNRFSPDIIRKEIENRKKKAEMATRPSVKRTKA